MHNVLSQPKITGKETRRQRRTRELEMKKMRRKTYTYEQMEEIVADACADMERQYDKIYATGLAVALSVEPTSFGPKRVCRTVGLFFDQIYAIRDGLVDEEDVIKEPARLGVQVKETKEGLEVYVENYDKESKKLAETSEPIIYEQTTFGG